MVKNLSAMQKMWVWFLGQEDPLEEGLATHSSILDWRIPWTEEPGGLQSMGSQRAGHDWAANTLEGIDLERHSLDPVLLAVLRVGYRGRGALCMVKGTHHRCSEGSSAVSAGLGAAIQTQALTPMSLTCSREDPHPNLSPNTHKAGRNCFRWETMSEVLWSG